MTVKLIRKLFNDDISHAGIKSIMTNWRGHVTQSSTGRHRRITRNSRYPGRGEVRTRCVTNAIQEPNRGKAKGKADRSSANYELWELRDVLLIWFNWEAQLAEDNMAINCELNDKRKEVRFHWHCNPGGYFRLVFWGYPVRIRSQRSSVSTVTKIQAGWPVLESREGQKGLFSLRYSVQTDSGVHKIFHSMGTRVFLRG
jgi:hypothetical protein